MSSISNDTTDHSDDDFSTSEDDDDDQSTSSTDSNEEVDVVGLDDTWPYGSQASNYPQKKAGKSKKIHQNDLERKRREEISESYRMLRESFSIKKCSRSQLLYECTRRIVQKSEQILKQEEILRKYEQLAKKCKKGRMKDSPSPSPEPEAP